MLVQFAIAPIALLYAVTTLFSPETLGGTFFLGSAYGVVFAAVMGVGLIGPARLMAFAVGAKPGSGT